MGGKGLVLGGILKGLFDPWRCCALGWIPLTMLYVNLGSVVEGERM